MSGMKTAIGLMSGTSMDGIDVALLRTDGESRVERGPFLSVPYDAGFRARLKAGLAEARAIEARQERPGSLARLERDLTLLHAVAVHSFLHVNGLRPEEIDVIGFHGQTVLHRPDAALTVQLGDGPLLAAETGIDVVYDMRANDMAHGGQGAPLVPAYHQALAAGLPDAAARPVAFVNIGGISNLTFIGGGDPVAYDSGPGNMLIDQWVELHTGLAYDDGGRISAGGTIDRALVGRYLEHPFFTANIRRSLDRGDFTVPQKGEIGLADGARTLAHVAAASILTAARHLPAQPKAWIVGGGGRLNETMMADLRSLAAEQGATVSTAEDAGFDGDAMEAEAWAYLAVRSLEGLPLTFPGTTGVERPVTGGVLARRSD